VAKNIHPDDDRNDRFVTDPGPGTEIYGPDGKPWKPGDPIPSRGETADEKAASGR
jgi:hypothetical protein